MKSKLLVVIVALLFIVACGTTYSAYNIYQQESAEKSSIAQDEKGKITISKENEQVTKQEEQRTVGFEMNGGEVEKAGNVPIDQEKAILASFDEYITAFNEKDLERYKNIISKNAEGFKYEDDIQAITEVFKQYDIDREAEDVTIVNYKKGEAQVFSTLKTQTKELKTGAELTGVGRQVTVFVKENDDWKVTSIYYSEVDTSYDSKNTSNTNSSYTEDELNNDPSAPSTNPNDYNSNGEYVPENGPSDNPADYSFDGEYKPVEDMTEEEKRAELESFFNNLGE